MNSSAEHREESSKHKRPSTHPMDTHLWIQGSWIIIIGGSFSAEPSQHVCVIFRGLTQKQVVHLLRKLAAGPIAALVALNYQSGNELTWHKQWDGVDANRNRVHQDSERLPFHSLHHHPFETY